MHKSKLVVNLKQEQRKKLNCIWIWESGLNK